MTYLRHPRCLKIKSTRGSTLDLLPPGAYNFYLITFRNYLGAAPDENGALCD